MFKIVITNIEGSHEHIFIHSTIFKKLSSFKVRIGKNKNKKPKTPMTFGVRKKKIQFMNLPSAWVNVRT